jgi:hypothetical protein
MSSKRTIITLSEEDNIRLQLVLNYTQTRERYKRCDRELRRSKKA